MTTYLFSAMIQILCIYSTKLYEACDTKANLEISSKVLLWRWKPLLDCFRYAGYYTHHHNRVLLLLPLLILIRDTTVIAEPNCQYYPQSWKYFKWMKKPFTSRRLCFLSIVSSWREIFMTFFPFIYNWWTNSITLNRRDSLVRILVLEQSHLLGEIIDVQNYLTTKNVTFPSAFFKEG